MSENIPESVPTSQDPRSKRPLKRRALSPNSKQASAVEALFANPDRDIVVPDAATLAKRKGLPPPPEIVANVQGSSAGAGSGEFHVYKASRRREYERLKVMDEENSNEVADADFERKREEKQAKDQSKTEKNRKKREKQRQRKGKAKGADGQNHDRNEEDEHQMPPDGLADDPVRTKESEANAHSNGAAPIEQVGVIIHDDD